MLESTICTFMVISKTRPLFHHCADGIDNSNTLSCLRYKFKDLSIHMDVIPYQNVQVQNTKFSGFYHKFIIKFLLFYYIECYPLVLARTDALVHSPHSRLLLCSHSRAFSSSKERYTIPILLAVKVIVCTHSCHLIRCTMRPKL